MKSLSEQASKISMALVVCITIGKFVAYLLSNSLTVYSEAWHGFSDLFTTFLIFVSIRLSNWNKNKEEHAKEEKLENQHIEEENIEKEKTKIQRAWAKVRQITRKAIAKSEFIAAMVIGGILTYIAITIMYRVIFYEKTIIHYPLATGITFIVFSFTSYFLYRFQTKVGEIEKSVALIADGQHSRSDMLTSLVTGFALILNSRGIDVDRYSAGLLSLLIFSFALQLMITTRNTMKGEGSLTSAFLRQRKKIPRKLLYPVLAIGFVVGLVYSMFTVVPVGYKALHLRFGEKIAVKDSGLAFKLPYPIDKLELIHVKKCETINIGNFAVGPLIWSQNHEKNTSEMITGDDNFIVPYIKLNYNIKDIESYYVYYKDMKKIVSDVAYNIVNYYILTHSFEAILLERAWIQEVKESIQKELDHLKTGIHILSFTIQDIHPPKGVSLEFEKLIATQQELITLKNRATSYRDLKLMKAETEAVNLKLMAEMNSNKYLQNMIGLNTKDGKMADIFNRYQFIVKRFLYLDMIAKTIGSNRKILLGKDSNVELRFEKKDKK